MQDVTIKPNLKKRLFWEYDYEHINWQKEAVGIIERVIERGMKEEWDELIRFYSSSRVIAVLKNDIKFLPDEVIKDACDYFQLKQDDLLCYTGKRLQMRHWI